MDIHYLYYIKILSTYHLILLSDSICFICNNVHHRHNVQILFIFQHFIYTTNITYLDTINIFSYFKPFILHSHQNLHGHSQHLLSHPAFHLHRPLTLHQHSQHPLPASASALQHHLRVCQHRLALQRTMKPSSMHHHHNDLMTTTPPSELKIQGIVSSQTQRQAEPTSRSSTELMQWSSVVRSVISSYRGEQLPSAAKSIPCKHQCKEEKLTSATRHQEERSSSTTVIISRREFEHRHRGEDHQSVIMFDYTFLINPHLSPQLTSEECLQDIGERVSSEWANQIHHIKQQKSSWAEEAHQSIIFLSAVSKLINGISAITTAHLVIVHNIVFLTLLHLHRVWPVHPGSLLDLRLHLHLLLAHLALLSVFGQAQPSHFQRARLHLCHISHQPQHRDQG